MNIECLTIGVIETNCYIIWGEKKSAMIIDPGDEADVILDFLNEQRLEPANYALTHGHMDHISALAAVSKKMPAPIGIDSADEKWAFSEQNQLPPFYGTPKRPLEITRFYKDGEEWNDIGSICRVISSPGHTPGGVCFYFPNEAALFSGDTLFRGSVGRTDLPGSDFSALTRSLGKLTQLPPETRVYPGHGPSTTIEIELRTNPFLTA